MVQSSLYKTVQAILSKAWIRHLMAWFVLFLVFYSYEPQFGNWTFHVSNVLLIIIFYMMIVYLNLWYLVPNYLSEKKFVIYLVLLLIAALMFTPIRTVVFYVKYSGFPDMQFDIIHYRTQLEVFFSNAVIGGASTLFKIVSDWIQQQRAEKELQTETMQSELRFLRSQINPHFLFNTLNNLYALTLKKSDKAPEIVIKLSEMMRYMLYECNERYVALVKEVSYIKNYLKLEQLRQGENVNVQCEIEESNIDDQQIAPLIFIPFIENSFKHGINNEVQKGYVHLNMAVEGKRIIFQIENSKPFATSNPKPNRSGGIGLENVKRRLNLLYPKNHALDIENEPNLFRVTLEMELKH